MSTIGLLGLSVIPGDAQEPDETPPTTAPVDLEAEKAKVDAAEADKARQVNAADAELGELTNALATLGEQVSAQSAKVEYANQQLAAAEQMVAQTEAAVAEAEAELAALETQVGDAAIRSFVGDEADRVVMFSEGDPNKAVRMDTMRAQATQTDIDLVEQLRNARADLDIQKADALNAVESAGALRGEAQAELDKLENDRAARAGLASAADDRLDHLLAEQAALQNIGAELDAGVAPATDDLVEQITAGTAPTPPVTDVTPPAVVSEGDIVDVGKGIRVHSSIADNVRRLLADADAAGINLAGGGYRSPDAQIQTRKNNCGTSNYAIYEMPASQCSPPTARPGRSNHEKGMAIDFTYNGGLIRSRSGAGWNWLKANAANYGLQNLPSEPWHWSIDGR